VNLIVEGACVLLSVGHRASCDVLLLRFRLLNNGAFLTMGRRRRHDQADGSAPAPSKDDPVSSTHSLSHLAFVITLAFAPIQSHINQNVFSSASDNVTETSIDDRDRSFPKELTCSSIIIAFLINMIVFSVVCSHSELVFSLSPPDLAHGWGERSKDHREPDRTWAVRFRGTRFIPARAQPMF
jgi:hypothetical protein